VEGVEREVGGARAERPREGEEEGRVREPGEGEGLEKAMFWRQHSGSAVASPIEVRVASA
jgi:hypothetical protein